MADKKSCMYKGQEYSDGSIVCQDDGELHRCNDGRWDDTLLPCPKPASGKKAPEKSKKAKRVQAKTAGR